MRHGPVGAAFLLLSAAPCLAQDAVGISTPVLSACIARVALEAPRTETDVTYGAIGLDGRPWLKIGDVDQKKAGSQKAALRAVGTGTWWTVDGKPVPLRFVCLIDHSGRAASMQANPQLPSEGNTLPPHSLITGTLTLAHAAPVPGGSELRVQLLDLAAPPPTAALAEQVVRTVQAGPIPFALRVAVGAPPPGRKLAISALVVQQGGGQLRLKQPRPLTEADLKSPVALTLE